MATNKRWLNPIRNTHMTYLEHLCNGFWFPSSPNTLIAQLSPDWRLADPWTICNYQGRGVPIRSNSFRFYSIRLESVRFSLVEGRNWEQGAGNDYLIKRQQLSWLRIRNAIQPPLRNLDALNNTRLIKGGCGWHWQMHWEKRNPLTIYCVWLRFSNHYFMDRYLLTILNWFVIEITLFINI